MTQCIAKIRRSSLAGIICLAAIACGGSGDFFLAGIEGTGVTSGFGSVFVNGTEFVTDNTEFIFNGAPATEDALRVGDVVNVTGTVDSNGRAVAQRIEFVRVLDGPIQGMSVQNGVGTINTLEQTIEIDEATNFINTSPAQLAMNDLIAVSGQLSANGVLRATSLEESAMPYVAGVTEIEADGSVSNLNMAANTFDIGVLEVNFSGANVDERAGALQNGSFVEVFGTQAGTGMPFMAETVTVVDRSVGEPGGRVTVDAIISSFNNAGDFQLNGQPVNAANAQRVDNAPQALANGVRVIVQGDVQAGVIVADTLAVRPPGSIRLNATVDSVSGDGFQLLGISAQVLPATEYIDASPASQRSFRINSLNSGDFVAALGFQNTAGQFTVTRLTRIGPADQSQVRGHVDSFDQAAGSLVLRGVTVRTDAGTVFRNASGQSIDAASFFSGLDIDDSVLATGPENANEINAADTVQTLEPDS